MQQLECRTRRLLILDGARNEKSVQKWVPYGGGCDTLITSCFSNWWKMPNVPVVTLGLDDAVTYLISQGNRPDDEPEREAARRDWCPVGRGVIPYATLLRGVSPDAVVLEFEDEDNPIASRPFLACVFSSG